MSLETGIKQTIDGDTLDECKRKLFEKYGNDFNIEKRESIIKPGFLFMRPKEIQRVTYTVIHRQSYSNESYGTRDTYTARDRESEQEKLEKSRQQILQNQSNLIINSTLSSIQNQVQEMNKKITEMNSNITSANGEMHETIKKIEELLEQNEFTFSYIRMIEDKIRTQFSLDELDDFNLVERAVVDWIGESIKIAPEVVFRPPHVVIIIGPTGVGKTTTLAKLAANTILDAKEKKVPRPQLCIFTIDSMRVGALEQLSVYCDIMEQKVLKAENTDDVKEIYEQNKEHVDYIFVDTGGYSPNDATNIAMMKNVLDINMRPDVYLTVSASTKASDLTTIFRNYEPLGYNSVIVTKCDETKQIGNIISVLWDRQKTISYITDGQRVPRNIRKANVPDILMTLTGFNIDKDHIENKFGEK